MRKARTFLNYNDAIKFAKEVNGTVEIKFWNCGQKDYIVSWYEDGGIMTSKKSRIIKITLEQGEEKDG